MSSPFDPITIGSINLPNRLMMAPVKTAYGTAEGRITDRLIAYFRRRAEGGVGCIISEPMYVDRRGVEHPKQIGIDHDDKLTGLRKLTDAVHDAGGYIFAHLNHGGRASNPKAAGAPPEAPSEVLCPRTGFTPHILSVERIEELNQGFADAARRAQDAGFDGVELQFGLGYLVAQFLSPATNLRTDEFGGSWDGRMRFAHEVFNAVRAVVGPGFPICVRISGSEKAPGGLEIDDASRLAQQLQTWGADLIHVVSGSNCDSLPWYFQHMSLPPGVNEGIASEIRQKLSVPVMVAGRLGDPARIREVLAEDMVDLIALGRPLLADPDLPNKMKAGHDDDVLLCGQCLQGCFVNVKAGTGIGCNVNPSVGNELEVVAPVEHPHRVVVIGGGPAGLQAALTASRRGHRVTLFEQDTLGGQMALAPLPPGKERIEKPLTSMISQARKAGIDIREHEEATAEKILALKPDTIIVATGSRPALPEIPGLKNPLFGYDVLTEARTTGARVAVIGGGMVGMEIAEFLARHGKEVIVIEMLDEVAADMDPIGRKLLLKRMGQLSVTLHTATTLERIEDGNAIIRHGDREQNLGPIDDFVIAIGNRSHNPLSSALDGDTGQVLVVGDADSPGTIYSAVSSGHKAGMLA